MNTLPAPILLDIAIFVTALSWGLGLYLVDKKAHVFASLAIGCFVCLLGYSVQSVGAPIWLVVAAPIPLDFLLLLYVLSNYRNMVRAEKLSEVVRIVYHNLGNLYRLPCFAKLASSLRFADSPVEIALLNL